MESIISKMTTTYNKRVIRNNNIRAINNIDLNSNTSLNRKAKALLTLIF